MAKTKWGAEQKEIVKLDAAWGRAATRALAAAATEKDFKAVAALYSNEGSIVWEKFDPGHGTDEIVAGWKKANKGFRNSKLEFNPVRIEIAGHLATDFGEVEFIEPDGKSTMAKYFVVWRREAGAWKVLYDCWNDNPPQRKRKRAPAT